MSTKQDKLCIIFELKSTYLLMTWFLTLPSSCKCFAGAGLGPGGSRLGDAWTWTGQFFSLWKPKIDQEEALPNKELCPCWISSYVPGFPSEGGNCFACRPGRSVALESHVLLLHCSTTYFCDFVTTFCLSVQIWGGRASFSLFWEPCLWLPSTRGVSISGAKKVPQNGKKQATNYILIL